MRWYECARLARRASLSAPSKDRLSQDIKPAARGGPKTLAMREAVTKICVEHRWRNV